MRREQKGNDAARANRVSHASRALDVFAVSLTAHAMDSRCAATPLRKNDKYPVILARSARIQRIARQRDFVCARQRGGIAARNRARVAPAAPCESSIFAVALRPRDGFSLRGDAAPQE